MAASQGGLGSMELVRGKSVKPSVTTAEISREPYMALTDYEAKAQNIQLRRSISSHLIPKWYVIFIWLQYCNIFLMRGNFFQYYYLIDSSAYPVLPGIYIFMSGPLLRPVYLLADADTRRLCHTRRPEKRRMSIRTASHTNIRFTETEMKIIEGRHTSLLSAEFDSMFFHS
jgi:hypothetical protein